MGKTYTNIIGDVMVVTEIVNKRSVVSNVYGVDDLDVLKGPMEWNSPKKGRRAHRELCHKYDDQGRLYVFDTEQCEFVPESERDRFLRMTMGYVGLSRLSRE